MKFILFGFAFNRLDKHYGLFIGTIFSVYSCPKGIVYIDYQEGEWDWDFLFLHFIYKRYFSMQGVNDESKL